MKIDSVTRLEIIEEIRTLKARYFRCVDTKDWDGFATLFTDNARFDISADVPGQVLLGRDAIVAAASQPLKNAITVHHGHCAEIEVISHQEAKAIWAMEDRIYWNDQAVDIPLKSLHGFGHYHETYAIADGHWKIATLRLTRLKVERVAR